MLRLSAHVAGGILEDRVAAEVPGQETPDDEVDDEAADESVGVSQTSWPGVDNV